MKSPTKILKNKLYLAAKLFLSVKLLLITFACFSYAYANTEFTFNPKNRIETVIAANELNNPNVIEISNPLRKHTEENKKRPKGKALNELLENPYVNGFGKTLSNPWPQK